MDFSANAQGAAGVVAAFITNGGNHTPETYAEMTANKILHVSATAAEPIQQQARAFRADLVRVLADMFRMAMNLERDAAAAALEREGMRTAAEAVRSKRV